MIAQESKQPLPVARSRSLIVKELPDETLIYDLETDEAHCLNRTAALVWKHCDGTRSPSDLATLLSRQRGTNLDDEVVWLALHQLQEFGLLSEPVSDPHISQAFREGT